MDKARIAIYFPIKKYSLQGAKASLLSRFELVHSLGFITELPSVEIDKCSKLNCEYIVIYCAAIDKPYLSGLYEGIAFCRDNRHLLGLSLANNLS